MIKFFKDLFTYLPETSNGVAVTEKDDFQLMLDRIVEEFKSGPVRRGYFVPGGIIELWVKVNGTSIMVSWYDHSNSWRARTIKIGSNTYSGSSIGDLNLKPLYSVAYSRYQNLLKEELGQLAKRTLFSGLKEVN